MIDSQTLDAVVVVSPDDLHHAIAMYALDAGLHVLCEKPLGQNVAEARELYETAESAGVKHMTYFAYRWPPVFRRAKQLIDEGYVGRPFQAYVRFLAQSRRGGAHTWRTDASLSNGTLADVGSHAIDLLRSNVGEIVSVAANLNHYIEHPRPGRDHGDESNDSATLSVEFDNGAQGLIQCSQVAYMAERRSDISFTLYGELGSIELNYSTGAGWSLRGARDGQESFKDLGVPVPGYFDSSLPPLEQARQMYANDSVGDRLFIDAILEDRNVSPDFHDGLKAQEVVDGALESARTGRRVRLNQGT